MFEITDSGKIILYHGIKMYEPTEITGSNLDTSLAVLLCIGYTLCIYINDLNEYYYTII